VFIAGGMVVVEGSFASGTLAVAELGCFMLVEGRLALMVVGNAGSGWVDLLVVML